MQGYKSEFSALYEMQNARSRCVATVGDCSRRLDRKRRTHVVRLRVEQSVTVLIEAVGPH